MQQFIDLLWFNVMHYSNFYQSFFPIYYGPYSSWKFLGGKLRNLMTFFETKAAANYDRMLSISFRFQIDLQYDNALAINMD